MPAGASRLCHSSIGHGWLIRIALASALHLPLELLLPAFLAAIIGLVPWKNSRRARLIWISVILALFGAIWFTLHLPHFDQNSLSTYNGIGAVTLEGVVLVRPSRPAEFRYGDRVRVTVLEHDQGTPSLAAIYAFHNHAYSVIQQILPEPQASLLIGTALLSSSLYLAPLN